MFLRLRVTHVFLWTLIVTSLVSSAVAAHPQERYIAWVENVLNLSAVQRAQVREILRPDSLLGLPSPFGSGTGSEGHPALGMLPFSGEFLDQLRSNQVDTTALNRLLRERETRLQAFHDRLVFKFVQLHALLTPAQRLMLADLIEPWLARAQEKRAESRKK
jgi:hypothetical protein